MISRRNFLLSVPALGLAAALAPRRLQPQAVQTFNGPMADANEVYRPVNLPAKPGATASMTDAQRDDLEHQIHCQCGCNLDVYTCRTTDFSCSVSPAMHADVMGLVSGGHTADERRVRYRRTAGRPVRVRNRWARRVEPHCSRRRHATGVRPERPRADRRQRE